MTKISKNRRNKMADEMFDTKETILGRLSYRIDVAVATAVRELEKAGVDPGPGGRDNVALALNIVKNTVAHPDAVAQWCDRNGY
jgi:hypothetical protein